MWPRFLSFSAVFRKDINLAHNTHLRFFHLKIIYYDGKPPTWVITLLSQITSPYLVEMCLEFPFAFDDPSHLNTIDWTPLVDLFNQQQWSNLQELKVLGNTYRASERSAAVAFVKSQFSVLESRGILRVVFPGSSQDNYSRLLIPWHSHAFFI